MKLDSKVSKMFVSRDGWIAAYIEPGDRLPWVVETGEKDTKYTWSREGEELKGDWLPVELPKFPELPPKPPQVLLRAHGRVLWYAVHHDRIRWAQGYDYLTDLPSDLKIIPHPDNDPEAVRLIEEAKR